jgi:hypothetical protein
MVSLSWCQAHVWDHGHIYIAVRQMRVYWCGAPSLTEDGSVAYNCCWASPEQLFSGPSPAGLMTVRYRLKFETLTNSKQCYDRGQSASVLVSGTQLGSMTPFLFLSHSWGLCGWPSLMRGRVCSLQFLLGLASAVIIGSETNRTHDHILLSEIWDSPSGESGPHIYIPQEKGGPFILPDTG